MTTTIALNSKQWTDTVHRTFRSLIAPAIGFRPVFADLTGSLTAALLLSQAYYWTDGRTTLDGEWFYKTAEEWERELRLTYREQVGARNRLRGIYLVSPKDELIHIWEESLRGVPATLHYRINDVALALALTIMQNRGQPIGGYRLVAPDCMIPQDWEEQQPQDGPADPVDDNVADQVNSEDGEKRESSSDKSANPDMTNCQNYTIDTEITNREKDQRVRASAEEQTADIDKGQDTGQPGGLAGLMSVRRKDYGQTKAQKYTQAAAEYRLDASAWVEYYKTLAEICGLTAMIEVDDIQLDRVRDDAIMLLKLNVGSKESLQALVGIWRTENEWRGATVKPSARSLATLQSKRLELAKESEAKAVALDENPMLAVEESLVDTDGRQFWSPTNMRKSRFDALVAQGRKVRLAQE